MASSISLPTSPSTVSSFLKAHERLILVVVIGAFVLFGYFKGINYLTAHDQLVVNKTQVALQSQVDANKKVADQAQQTASQYQQLVQQLITSNKQIAAAQVQRVQDTKQQQAVDATLSPDALATRWTSMLSLSSGVTVSAAGYMATPVVALATVQQLESVPELQANLNGQQTLVANDSKQIDGLSGVVASLKSEVTGLNSQITDQSKACVAQVNLVKAQARKSKFVWFGIGYVAGFISREIIKP